MELRLYTKLAFSAQSKYAFFVRRTKMLFNNDNFEKPKV